MQYAVIAGAVKLKDLSFVLWKDISFVLCTLFLIGNLPSPVAILSLAEWPVGSRCDQ
jgi:hypothetical protein